MSQRINQIAQRIFPTLRLAARKFIDIDGGQRASAFAYNAFFALFPLIVLFVTAASYFTGQEKAAGVVITFVEKFIPLNGEMQHYVFDTISRVIDSRGSAGTVALLMLVWLATQFFTTLIQASNRAWGTTGSNWWKLPLKSLALLATLIVGVLVGISAPLIGRMAGGLIPAVVLLRWAYRLGLLFVPWVIVFFSLAFFYRLAPHRRTKYSEIWFSALCASLLLYAAQNLFVLYLKHFAAFNAVYGAFGGIMALLVWTYVSGVIFIYCACMSAAQAATRADR
ncbi:MAG: hypothetical protein COX65_02600 [Elusimicrobia bacterium CG_4_10_14_0_2_um_filter_56_8]|nr:MAG: hypothetical protein AUJ51_10855 [Elusimicrobia bacterium CG1_02_56_21]PJA16396.1 MAG: hypothetical protein COX65_02600 [Elusimicrobia bacterium CG_4_10_14_0_2_um_filter_56_8]